MRIPYLFRDKSPCAAGLNKTIHQHSTNRLEPRAYRKRPVLRAPEFRQEILTRPIIIVGSGRSGTTLLNATLGAHPAILMLGETNFAFAQVWSTLSGCPANVRSIHCALEDYYQSDVSEETACEAMPEKYKALLPHLEREEDDRRAAALRETFDRLFRLTEADKSAWGFKEIWNGGARQFEWDIYDKLFPNALWVHIVRHPAHQAQSSVAHLGADFTRSVLEDCLRNWVGITEKSRQRSATGRFFELRYEGLCTAPDRTLKPLLDTLGLAWHPRCGLAAQRSYGRAPPKAPLPKHALSLIDAVPRLRQLMAEFGYSADEFANPSPREASSQSRDLPRPRLEAIGDGRWRLLAPFFHESGHAWEFDLSSQTQLGEADEVGDWARSRLRLHENGIALGPAHCLHVRIRRMGLGAFSHWQNRLIFSTSDNSDPNFNGRQYTISDQ
jgi:hypothetical protein